MVGSITSFLLHTAHPPITHHSETLTQYILSTCYSSKNTLIFTLLCSAKPKVLYILIRWLIHCINMKLLSVSTPLALVILLVTLTDTNAFDSPLPQCKQNRRQVLSTIATTSSLLTFPKSSNAVSSAVSVPAIDLPSTSPLPTKKFPLASFGLQIYDNDTAYKLTTTALQAGYRNFFASVLAGNQKGFAQAIRDSNIPREQLYICGTVLSNRAKGYKDAFEKTERGCLDNLNVMNRNSNGKIGYLDMIMLDYPCIDQDGVKGQWDGEFLITRGFIIFFFFLETELIYKSIFQIHG